MTQVVKFINTEKSEFFPELKRRVDTYFENRRISKHANAAMVFKTVFFLSSLVGLYTLILLEIFPNYIQLLMAVLLGMTMAFIGFNVCHDALHGSYSSNKTVNKALGFVFNLLGANGYVWSISHNIVHHTFTNIPGHDEDIDIAPGLIRVYPEDKKTKIQKYQHIYAFFLYCLTSLSWVFRKDYKKFFQKKIGNHRNKHPKIEYFNLFFFKALYYALYIVIPLLVMDNITWWQYLIGFLALNFAEGLVLGLVFQLAHVVEGPEMPNPDENLSINDAWAVHQMKTTANFAMDSRIASFLCGGLNMQIEHHLFPKVCHIHYPKISKIVKKAAQEYNLPYHENKTFVSALKSHYHALKRMAQTA